MKVIELLTKIANGEEALLIKYRDKILHWNKDKDRFEDKDGMNTLYEMDFSELNEEVEVVEEDKKIEKLENEKQFYSYRKYADIKNDIDKILYIVKGLNLTEEKIDNLNNKINEIVDYINGGTNGE